MKRYSVWMHFNRINMQRGDPRVWTVHFRGTCYQVEGFKSRVPLVTRYKATGRQPRATLRGWAVRIDVLKGQAMIT